MGDAQRPRRPGELLLVVRVAIPDRPGALGLVASRIGALGADIAGIDVLETGPSVAVDEFAIVLPRGDLETLLVREIEQVDGASVEECREVEEFPDARTDALASVERLCTARDDDALLQDLADDLRLEFAADWAAVLRHSRIVTRSGLGLPDEAALVGLCSSSAPRSTETLAVDCLAMASIPALDAVLAVCREDHPFRAREYRQLLAITRIADLLAARLTEH